MKKHFFSVVMLLSLALTACSNTNNTKEQHTVPATEKLSDTSEASKVKITIDGKVFTFKLADNRTARE